MDKIPFVLISEKYGDSNLKSNKVGVIRFMFPQIQKTLSHTYLSIYENMDSENRCSSIECDNNLTFDVDSCLMIYIHMKTTMVYKFNSKEETELVKNLFNKEV